MKKYFLILMTLPVVAACCAVYIHTFKNVVVYHENTEMNDNLQEDIVDTIYGRNGVDIDLQNLLYIKDLVELIDNSSTEELQQVAFLVAKKLEENKSNDPLDLYIIHYLQQMACVNIPQNIDESIELTVQKLFDYIQFEQAHILHNQKKRFVFLQAQKSSKLPPLMSFWTSTEGLSLVDSSDLHASDDTVVIQDMMSDMAIMIGAQMGASLANEQIGTQATDLANILTQQSQTIQANIKSFQTQAQASQQKSLQVQITNFSNKGKDIQTQTQAAIDTSNLELNYLYQNISLNKPQQQYLSSPVVFDQIFSQGDMLTPDGYVWKNPFSVGDWEYAKEEDSFYQCQNSPIFTKDSNGVSSSIKAENNAIFTEYASTQATYTISGVITIYQVDSPFFVGIIFNKSRWISGNYEALRKARMVGIYGKSDTDIGVYFAEQYTMTDQQLQVSGSDDPIQQPLAQILANSVDKKLPIPLDTFKDLKINPVSFNFEITTTPVKVTFAFWNDKNARKDITVDNLNSQMFIYHGIGFISPGAIAEFKLQEPKNLLFTPDAISKFKD